MSDPQRELIALLGRSFVQRRDVKAWQRDNGEWFPEKSPMTTRDFEDHLSGRKTMGHYMVDHDGECKLFAFDIDIVDGELFTGPHEDSFHGVCEKKGSHRHPFHVKGEAIHLRKEWLDPNSPYIEHLTIQLRCMAEGLALRTARIHEIPVAISNSGGKGVHVYGFTGSLPAKEIRILAMEIIDGFGCFTASRGTNFFRHDSQYKALEIEVFPKQDDLEGKEFGNLMKLPLGINRKTGNKAEFITCKTGYNGLIAMDPMRALQGDLPWE